MLFPKGAAILNAYVQFKVDNQLGGRVADRQGQAADTTVAFNDGDPQCLAAAPDRGLGAWTPAAWPTVGTGESRPEDPQHRLGDPGDRQPVGWASSNSLVILISGTGKRVAEAYNGDKAGAPLLHVEYK